MSELLAAAELVIFVVLCYAVYYFSSTGHEYLAAGYVFAILAMRWIASK